MLQSESLNSKPFVPEEKAKLRHMSRMTPYGNKNMSIYDICATICCIDLSDDLVALRVLTRNKARVLLIDLLCVAADTLYSTAVQMAIPL